MQRLFVIENCSDKIKSIYFIKTEIHEYHMRYRLAKMFHRCGLNLNNESEKNEDVKWDEFSHDNLVSTKLIFHIFQ